MLLSSNDAATTTAIDGHIELHTTSLHQMCKTKQPSETCYI